MADNGKVPFEKFNSYEEFWPYYLSEHSHPKNRKVHAIATPVGIGLTAAFAVAVSPWLIPVGVAGIYASLWALGHQKYEGNKPSTLKHPAWSFVSDFRMIGLMYAGKIEQEFEKYGIDHTGNSAPKAQDNNNNGGNTGDNNLSPSIAP